MKKIIFLFFFFHFSFFCVFAQEQITISGSVEWDNARVNAAVSLNMINAGLRLPAGRTQGEALLRTGYSALIQPVLLGLQVDSSSTVGDLIERGEFSLSEVNALAQDARSVAPSLSSDMRHLTASHSISLVNVTSALLRRAQERGFGQSRPSPVMRTLNPVSAAQYTGIIIIALDELPVHGMRRTAMAVPCLFPKIWDSEMNLIFDRNMLRADVVRGASVFYAAADNIFQRNPSGLSDGLQNFVGERPLRIFARGVFGTVPTDLIIDINDAMLIISSEENRNLLSQGRVAFILDESVLRKEFGGEAN